MLRFGDVFDCAQRVLVATVEGLRLAPQRREFAAGWTQLGIAARRAIV
jgi:hypothetical protein